jgi:hypothetical protein
VYPESIMNLLEQYISKNIPIETWRAACSSSPSALDVCGLILAAAGLVDLWNSVSLGLGRATEHALLQHDTLIRSQRRFRIV